MTGIEDLQTLLDETEGAPLPLLLDRIIAALPDDASRRARIAELVDESRTAWQWLLGGRRRGRILHLSGGWNASAMALARVWEQVTVLEPLDASLRVLERRIADEGFRNVELIPGECHGRLPCADAVFDAVCWTAAPGRRVPCADDGDEATLTPLLREAARVLKPDGELLLGLPNRWRRSSLLQKGEPPLFTLGNVVRTLRGAGFGVHSVHAHENEYEQERFFVDLDDVSAIRAFQDQHPGRGRHLPLWVYRRLAPQYAVVAGKGPAESPWLRDALQAVRNHLGLRDGAWTVSPPAVQRKGKLVSVLSRHGRPAWIVKIPLRPETRAGIENARRVLSGLSAHLTVDDPLAGLLPGGLERLDFEGMSLYVESICRGRPWASHLKRMPGVTDTDLPEVLARLLELDAGDLGLSEDDDGLSHKLDHLRGLMTHHAPELVDAMTAVGGRLEDAARGRPWKLRKGDMTLSNVFLENGRVSGLIDWDESEVARLPLAAYADLVFSWLWQREELRRAESLARLIDGELDALPRALGVREVLSRLDCGPDDLAIGAVASWVDHAHYELTHPVFRYQPDRIRSLLVEPCRAVARAWGQPIDAP
ncbi:methyltransferase domain-containing protein [bacterium]|nr:methyltransferase domain-containing protein [bacterium]